MADPSAQRSSGFSENIDFKKILKEAAREMDAEDKYQRENDAKFRAVYQKVATYEDFCDIVKASSLKPLDRTDSVSLAGAGRCTWNVNAIEHPTKQQNCEGIQPISTEPGSTAIAFDGTDIHTQSEFYKVYWKLSTSDKYLFLLQIGGDRLLALFPIEVDVFNDIILVLYREFRTAHFKSTANILGCIARMERFTLAILFIDDSTRKNLTSLLKLMTDSMRDSPPTDETEKVVSVYTKYL